MVRMLQPHLGNKFLQYREENCEKYDRSQQVVAPEAAPMSPEFHSGYVDSSRGLFYTRFQTPLLVDSIYLCLSAFD
jgi:hypothetical protein